MEQITNIGLIGLVSEEEVKITENMIKKKKVVEPDEVSIEMRKILEDVSIGWSKDLFNMGLIKGKILEDWRKSFVVPIFKGKGD